MAHKKFYIKVRGSWSNRYEWYSESRNLYCKNSEIGKASTFQDAIDIAKSHCNADKNAIIEMTD